MLVECFYENKFYFFTTTNTWNSRLTVFLQVEKIVHVYTKQDKEPPKIWSQRQLHKLMGMGGGLTCRVNTISCLDNNNIQIQILKEKIAIYQKKKKN